MKLRHAIGVECKQPRNIEVKIFKDITCPRCRQLLKSDDELRKTFDALTPPEVIVKIPEKPYFFNYNNGKKSKELITQAYLTCNCGSKLKVRINKSTRTQFLGCSDYPICKKTKPYYR